MPEENPHLYDIRVVERYINKGDVDAKDYTDHLKNLPDLADSVVELKVPVPGSSASPLGRPGRTVTTPVSEANNSEG